MNRRNRRAAYRGLGRCCDFGGSASDAPAKCKRDDGPERAGEPVAIEDRKQREGEQPHRSTSYDEQADENEPAPEVVAIEARLARGRCERPALARPL